MKRVWDRGLAKHQKQRVSWAKPKRGELEGTPPRHWAKSGAMIEVQGGNDSDEGMRSEGGSEDE